MNKKNMYYTVFFELCLINRMDSDEPFNHDTCEVLSNSISYIYEEYWY